MIEYRTVRESGAFHFLRDEHPGKSAAGQLAAEKEVGGSSPHRLVAGERGKFLAEHLHLPHGRADVCVGV